ncbi:MAG TPA: hypothetical protein VES88_00695 [Gemmatimonadaceae bacterium]|nr:hypothetical protein [Gemmatimonadaceae bacterium]
MPGEEPAFDDAAETLVEGSQPGERLVHVEERIRLIFDRDGVFVERDPAVFAAVLRAASTTGFINQHVAHGDPRYSEEVRAVLPSRMCLRGQPEVRLVYEGGGAKCRVRAPGSELSVCDAWTRLGWQRMRWGSSMPCGSTIEPERRSSGPPAL